MTNQELSLQDRLKKGFDLLREKENQEALELLNNLLESDPENDRGWLLFGIANRRIGKMREAITSFQKATELNNSSEEAWGLLTITYLDSRQEERANKCLLRAIELNPSREELKFYRHNLIRIYKTFGPFF